MSRTDTGSAEGLVGTCETAGWNLATGNQSIPDRLAEQSTDLVPGSGGPGPDNRTIGAIGKREERTTGYLERLPGSRRAHDTHTGWR